MDKPRFEGTFGAIPCSTIWTGGLAEGYPLDHPVAQLTVAAATATFVQKRAKMTAVASPQRPNAQTKATW